MNVFIEGLLLILLVKSCHGQCRHWSTPEFHFASNRNLQGHVFQMKAVSSAVICGRDCSMDPRCASFNYDAGSHLCELNNQTRLQSPCTFVEKQGSFYFDDNKKTSAGADGSREFSIVGKPAQQSSDHKTRVAGNAVDGSSSSARHHCSHTSKDPAPWWRVDLGEDHCISKVRILNRGDCCSHRLTGAVVRAGGDNTTVTDNPSCGSPVTAAQAQPLGCTIEFDCSPELKARYVSVDIQYIPGTGILQLCEVTVEEIPLDHCSGESSGA
ncbi:pentraxin fusion protein-like [Patiria miniata]|uniref:Apple domain-containing protein n=1 Tax=Patiria miniata TaxID=46514 RepID=A0A914AC18_PATMI|nr:pentraxin fusion protein-like [Patiria miniata]